ncbi:MAG: transcriptional regulator [Betaproteobacteria bacterium]|nr:transcriptional regulator [Betaproteobacteria bacterium]
MASFIARPPAPPSVTDTAKSTRAADYMRVPRAVGAMAKDFPAGHVIPEDTHTRGQLLYAVAGVMSVHTEHGAWVVPPQRAVWVPPATLHTTRMSGNVAMRTLYVRKRECERLPPRCCVINVTPLLRELILRAVELPMYYEEAGPGGRVMALILDEMAAADMLPLHLPRAADARVFKVCEMLLSNPADTRGLADFGSAVGASERNLARLFLRETGMSFAAWRQQARLVVALEQLAQRAPIGRIAESLGYESASAFTAMFKKSLGVAPKDYFA